jgi:hypothetical protein
MAVFVWPPSPLGRVEWPPAPSGCVTWPPRPIGRIALPSFANGVPPDFEPLIWTMDDGTPVTYAGEEVQL